MYMSWKLVWKHNKDVELDDKMKDSHERMNENVMEEWDEKRFHGQTSNVPQAIRMALKNLHNNSKVPKCKPKPTFLGFNVLFRIELLNFGAYSTISKMSAIFKRHFFEIYLRYVL